MGQLSLMTVLGNGTKTDLNFIVCPRTGTRKPLVLLRPGGTFPIRANKYYQNSKDSLIPRIIEVHIVDPLTRKERLGCTLTPSEIKNSGEITLVRRTTNEGGLSETPGRELDPKGKKVSFFKRIELVRKVTRMMKEKARPTEAEDVLKVSISPEETLPIHAQGSSVVPEPVPPGQAVPPDTSDVAEDNLEGIELDDDLNRNRVMDTADDHTLADTDKHLISALAEVVSFCSPRQRGRDNPNTTAMITSPTSN